MFRKKISGIMVLIVGIMFVGAIAIGLTACDGLSHDDNTDNANAEYGWYGNGSSNSFTISNFTQLAELAKIVKGSTGYNGPVQSDFKGKTVTLTTDIDMSGKSWNGIGYSYIPLYPFNGTFDGNNKTISGLHTRNQGFLGLIGEDGIVKNIIFVDLSVDGNDGGGGLTRTNRGKIQNISITNGSVKEMPGGVVYSNYGIVENCNFSGTVAASLGGAGGIAYSNSTSGVVRNCYITGSVTGSFETGGIVGRNSGTVQSCYATSNINGTGSIADGVGGIVGLNTGTVKNCYATGNITGSSRVGGVVGDSYNGTVQNCYATGNVTGVRTAGGITGYSGTIQNCVALNPSITATSTQYSSYGYPGRVGGGVSLLNNYGSNGMILPSLVTVTSDANDIHGEGVEASDYNNQTWWTTAVNWDFTTVWEWDSTRNLPKLRM
jgi:hypothetical protein